MSQYCHFCYLQLSDFGHCMSLYIAKCVNPSTVICYLLFEMQSLQKVCEYKPEMPQSQTADQPTALRGTTQNTDSHKK